MFNRTMERGLKVEVSSKWRLAGQGSLRNQNTCRNFWNIDFILPKTVFQCLEGWAESGQTSLTLRHRAGADVSSQAAAFELCGVVAGHDVDLIAGEMLQVWDDCGLLGEHLYLHLSTRETVSDQSAKHQRFMVTTQGNTRLISQVYISHTSYIKIYITCSVHSETEIHTRERICFKIYTIPLYYNSIKILWWSKDQRGSLDDYLRHWLIN